MTNVNRAKLGVAFAAVAGAGVVLGFVLSTRMDLPGGVAAAPFDATPTVAVGGPLGGGTAPAGTPPPVATTPVPAPGDNSFVKLAKDLGPAVAFIQTRVVQRDPFFGMPTEGRGAGTGFIISPDGYMLTNAHVIDGARVIKVSLPDEREYQGKVIGSDPATDVALIKIEDRAPLPYVRLGDSDHLEVGEWVIAIGNPLGLSHSVTAGIVSAKGRRDVTPGGNRSPYFDFIQTDAAINPGNSGGPLINTRGEVIGINSAVANAPGAGIGFAIPINMAKQLVPLLKQHGRVPRSWIGINIGPVTKDLAARLGLTDTSGARVEKIVPGSPAHKYGLKPGEVILSFDGKPIKRSEDLPWLASLAGIGRTVTVVVADAGGGRREVKLTLEEKPE